VSEYQPDGAGFEVGATLRRAREAQGASPDEAGRVSGVPEWAITALEAGEPTEIAGQPRLLAHLRVYGRFLGFDAGGLLHGVSRAAAGGAGGGGAADGRRPAAPHAEGGASPSAPRRRRLRVAVVAGAVAVVGLAAAVTVLLLTGPLDALTVNAGGGAVTARSAADTAGGP
jgi:cytoskeletal protein RodZ